MCEVLKAAQLGPIRQVVLNNAKYLLPAPSNILYLGR